MYSNQLSTLIFQINSLTSYMQTKIEARDWHAVADAAMDIRELEAKIEVYKSLESL